MPAPLYWRVLVGEKRHGDSTHDYDDLCIYTYYLATSGAAVDPVASDGAVKLWEIGTGKCIDLWQWFLAYSRDVAVTTRHKLPAAAAPDRRTRGLKGFTLDGACRG